MSEDNDIEKILRLTEECARRQGRRTSLATYPGAVLVRALVERHGCTKKRAVEIVQLVLWDYAGKAILFTPSGKRMRLAKTTSAALERAYQKLVKSRRVSYVSDRSSLMSAALAKLRA
jgi:hypothetical protein